MRAFKKMLVLVSLAVGLFGIGALGAAFWLSEELTRSGLRAPTLQWVTPRGLNEYGLCPREPPRTLETLMRGFRDPAASHLHLATYLRAATRCMSDGAVAALAQEVGEAARRGDQSASLVHDALARHACRSLVTIAAAATGTATVAQVACADVLGSLVSVDVPADTQRTLDILRTAELVALLGGGETREDLVMEFCAIIARVIIPNVNVSTTIAELQVEHCGW